jgi:serine/threonine-protein kinase
LIAAPAIAILVAGCNHGGTTAEQTTTAPITTTPPVAVVALDGLLLSAAEANTALGTTRVTVAGTWTQMLDASSHIPEKDCAFVNPTDRSIYAVSGWNAVR